MGTQVLLLENIQQLTKAGSKGREPEAIIGVSLNETHLVLLLNEIYIRMLCTSCHKSLPALILCVFVFLFNLANPQSVQVRIKSS